MFAHEQIKPSGKKGKSGNLLKYSETESPDLGGDPSNAAFGRFKTTGYGGAEDEKL